MKSPTTSPMPKPSATTPSPTGTLPTTPKPIETLGVEAKELRGTVIHFWHAWSGESRDTVEALVDEFNLGNEWGILVVPVHQSTLDEMDESVAAWLGTGDQPDLVIGYLHQALAWDADGDLVDLQAYVQDPVWGFLSEETNDFYPVFWNQDFAGAKRIGIPAERSGQMLFYNATWARELGFLIPPSSPGEFRKQACAAARANRQDDNPDNDGSGGWIISTDPAAMQGWINAFGGKIVGGQNAGDQHNAYNFDSPKIEASFEFLRSLYDDGCAWLAESQYPDVEFANRRGLFAIGSVMDIPYQADAFQAIGNRDQWTVIPFPSPLSDPEPAITVYGPSFEILSSTPQRQLAAWLFVKWLLAPENQAQLLHTTGAFPLRESVLEEIRTARDAHLQWAAAIDLLDVARPEPDLHSWGVVRWALGDAATQIFRSYFSVDQVPVLVNLLEYTASELHGGYDPEEVFATATGTPAGSPEPVTTTTKTP